MQRRKAGFLEPAQFEVTCKDGRTRGVEISAIIVGNAILASFVDFTEHKRLEDALRSSGSKFEAALFSMTDAVFISDAAGVLIVNELVSNAFKHGFPDQNSGKSMWS